MIHIQGTNNFSADTTTNLWHILRLQLRVTAQNAVRNLEDHVQTPSMQHNEHKQRD